MSTWDPVVLATAAVAALCLLFLLAALPAWVQQVQDRLIFRDGDWVRADRWLRLCGALLPEWNRQFASLAIAEFSGRTAVALQEAERLASTSRELASVNQCVTVFINAGRYERALDVAAPWTDPPSHPARSLWALLQVNTAEAEYNLGRWHDALARLDRMRAAFIPVGIVNAGDWQQRAWILVHLGQTADARAAASEVDPADLPHVFHAEHQFTLGRVSLAAGEATHALACVDAGLRVARRASSMRNGLFLRARFRAATGEVDAALDDFEKAANMPYQAQGGDGLLAWGDLLRTLGREAEARRAFALVEERDPESESARHARERLAHRLEADAREAAS